MLVQGLSTLYGLIQELSKSFTIMNLPPCNILHPTAHIVVKNCLLLLCHSSLPAMDARARGQITHSPNLPEHSFLEKTHAEG